MKKCFKFFICFLLLIVFSFKVNATTEEEQRAIEAMNKYCQKDQSVKGCVYDKNDTLYTLSGKHKNTNVGSWDIITFKTDSNTPLTRGYVTADGNGNIMFAGCYREHFKGGTSIKEGDYFLFKIVALKGGKCQVIDDDIVFAKGTEYRDWSYKTFDGKTSMGQTMATYNGWTAVNGGDCPIGFGLTANTKWYTSKAHTYIFANDASGFNIGVTAFLSSEAYKTTPGCTVQDQTGHEEAEKCFNEAANKIKNEKCPKEYSELSKLSSTLKEYQDSCDNKFRTLYSKGLLESDAKEMKEKLISAVNEKLSSCQAGQCSLTSAQVSSINNKLAQSEYKTCSKGTCPGGSYPVQSSSPTAKCYRVGNGTDTVFEWTDTPSKQPAYVESSMTKSECYGTYDTRNCRTCLKKVYTAAGLSETQINCMLNIEADKAQIATQSEQEIEQQFSEKTEEKLQESEQIRQQVYQSYTKAAAAPDVKLPDADPSMTGCTRILGPNLTAIVKASITILQIVGAIIAIVKGMMTLIPPILAKDADALKKASKTLTTMAIILVVIFLFKPILTFIGNILDFDTSCIV